MSHSPKDQDRKAGVCVDCGVWTCSHTDDRLDAARAEVEALRALNKQNAEVQSRSCNYERGLRFAAEAEVEKLRAELAETKKKLVAAVTLVLTPKTSE